MRSISSLTYHYSRLDSEKVENNGTAITWEIFNKLEDVEFADDICRLQYS